MTLTPTVGLALDGAHVTAGDLAPASLGAPVWGPRALLTDLELRFGLGPLRIDPVARMVAARDWLAAEIERGGPGTRAFHARSFAVDPWGTTRTVLELLDTLKESGWDGQDVSNGGARLPVLRALAAGISAGESDRLVRLEARIAEAFGAGAAAPYPSMVLADPTFEWPGRWQRVLALLARLGTALRVEGVADPETLAPLDGRDSDLARVQRFLVLGGARPTMRGDGTLVLLRAETPEPLADALAAVAATLAGHSPDATMAVLRTAEHGALDAALARQGMPRLGGRGSLGVPLAGAWLPLLVALTRTPFDVEAAVDLVLLPDAGWAGRHVGALAGALAQRPGIGAANETWQKALGEVRATDPDGAARVERWLTPAAVSSADELDAAELAERVRLVDAVLQKKTQQAYVRARAHADDHAGAAAADAFETARTTLAAWVRALPAQGAIAAAPLDALLRNFGVRATGAVTPHEAGVLERADDPAAIRAPVDAILWWGFVDPGAPPASPFRQTEREALRAIGVRVPEPMDALARQAAAWRGVLLRARRRLVLAFPERIGGARQRLHPLWSELCGRLDWDGVAAEGEHDLERAAHAITGRGDLAAAVIPTRVASAAAIWNMPERATGTFPGMPDSVSVSALGNLLACPLRFVLEKFARVAAREVGLLPAVPVLFGNLGHHLFEVLFARGLLAPGLDDAAIGAVLDELIAAEGAPLARPGRASARRATTRQFVAAVQSFVAWLAREGLTPVALEEEMKSSCAGQPIHGRVDFRARGVSDAGTGAGAIVDFKWSTRPHEEAVAGERAVQLASYVHAHMGAHDAGGSQPRAAFFGLRDGRLAEADPARIARTWAHMERMLPKAQAALATRRVLVTGVPGAPSLAAALGLEDPTPPPDTATICKYCRFDLLCGRTRTHTSATSPDEEQTA